MMMTMMMAMMTMMTMVNAATAAALVGLRELGLPDPADVSREGSGARTHAERRAGKRSWTPLFGKQKNGGDRRYGGFWGSP